MKRWKNMLNIKIRLTQLIVLTAFMLTTNYTTVNACTGIRLIAKDKSVVYGRSMEWGAFDLHSRVTIIPKGYKFRGLTPDGYNGKKWTSKYGVVALDMIHKMALADGMNEKGLTAGLFYHPGFAEYPKYDPKKSEKSITAIDVVTYILTQYATVDEVKKGMAEILVVPVVEEALGIVVDVHFIVTDTSGKSIVIEFTNGKVKIHNNPLGVLTNSPNFDWHMVNLRNYVNISQEAIPDKKIQDLDFKPLGAGSGMIGLPGDMTPPSRFIRAIAFSQTARETSTSSETVYELFRILDNFNLGLGSSEGSEHKQSDEDFLRSSTLWTTAWDTKNRVFYYHTQHNRRVRMIDLKAIDFSKIGSSIVYLPLDKKREQDIEDITPKK